MKRILASVLAVIMMLGATGCGNTVDTVKDKINDLTGNTADDEDDYYIVPADGAEKLSKSMIRDMVDDAIKQAKALKKDDYSALTKAVNLKFMSRIMDEDMEDLEDDLRDDYDSCKERFDEISLSDLRGRISSVEYNTDSKSSGCYQLGIYIHNQ